MARKIPNSMEVSWEIYGNMAVCQNLVPLVNIKIAGKWMFIPLKMVLIGIDPYPYSGFSRPGADYQRLSGSAQRIATPHHRSPCDRDGQQVCAERSPVRRMVPDFPVLWNLMIPRVSLAIPWGFLGGYTPFLGKCRLYMIVYCQLKKHTASPGIDKQQLLPVGSSVHHS